VKRGVDRVKVTSCILASVLTAVGIATGDTLFYGLMIAKSQQVPLTTGLLGWTVLHLVQLKFEFSPLLTAFDILIIIAAAELCGLPRSSAARPGHRDAGGESAGVAGDASEKH
jgi:hypothetical protein